VAATRAADANPHIRKQRAGVLRLAIAIDRLGHGPVLCVKYELQLAQFSREPFGELGMRPDHCLHVDRLALGPSPDTVLDNPAEAVSRFRLLRTAEKRIASCHTTALAEDGQHP